MPSLKRVWHSPTMTTWVYQATMSLQMFLVAPIILRHFNTVEISAWYLFASLNIFGNTVLQRVTLTYSRMIAMAVIPGGDTRSDNFARDWETINRIVSTMAVFQVPLILVNVFVAVVLAWFGLEPLLRTYSAAHEIVMALAIYQLGSIGAFYVSRYHAVLLGLNAVAVSNRWNTTTLAAGLLGVALTVYTGHGIIAAAAVNASIATLGGILARTSIRHYSSGRLVALEHFRLHRDIAAKAVAPIFKSLANQLALSGMLPLASIIVTRQGDASVAASLNFSSRIIAAIEQTGLAPFNSIQPWVSSLMAQRSYRQVHSLLIKRGGLSLALIAGGMISVGLLLPYLFHLLHTQIRPLPFPDWIFLCAAVLLARAYVMLLAPLYAINNIALTSHAVVAAVLGAALMMPGCFWAGVAGIGAAVIIANLAVFRTTPVQLYRTALHLK